jgi:malate/lactate dehydrogenase
MTLDSLNARKRPLHFISLLCPTPPHPTPPHPTPPKPNQTKPNQTKPTCETCLQRGAAIIKARGLSSALSAASSACDHIRDWVLGTPEGTWVSMGVFSDGTAYGAPAGVMYSFPVTCAGGTWSIVGGLSIDPVSAAKMAATGEELVGEKALAFECLKEG